VISWFFPFQKIFKVLLIVKILDLSIFIITLAPNAYPMPGLLHPGDKPSKD
jgi:hypothetical protein